MINKLFNLSVLTTALIITTNQAYPDERSLELTQFLSPSNSTLEGLDQLYSCRLSTDNRFFYCVSMENHVLGVYSRDETTGTLTQIQTVNANAPGDEFNGLSYVCFSPDEKNLYLADYKKHTIFTYRRYTQTGTVEEIDVLTDQSRLNGIGVLDFTPDGKWGVGTLYNGNGVVVLKRNSLNGTLTYTSGILNEDIDDVDIAMPNHLKVSPDGNFVYVCNFGSESENYENSNIAIFSINNTTGQLSFVGKTQNNMQVENLVGVRWVELTEDGTQLYAIAAFSDTVHLFDRNTSTGRLTPVKHWQDTERFDYPRVVKLSPEEDFLYVTGFNTNTLTQFRRDLDTGEISDPLTYTNGPTDSEKGLLNTRQIDITNDGKFLYTCGWPDYDYDNNVYIEYSGIGVFKINYVPDVIKKGSTWVLQ